MSGRLRAIVRNALPQPMWQRLRQWNARRRMTRLRSQPMTTVRCGNYDLDCPASHILLDYRRTQPLRDASVGVAARHLGAKYPDATMIDIGANIGDTAAIIASNATNPLLLVEPSAYYFGLLQRNTSRWPNPTIAKNVLVSGEPVTAADVHHWGGTAVFTRNTDAVTTVRSERLSELTSNQVCFVKTDTDGYDFELLSASAAWLKVHRPGILLEVQIRSQAEGVAAARLFADLKSVGYTYFSVWDDAGWPIIANATGEIVRQLNRYLMLTWCWPSAAKIYNFDILCLHANDADVHAKVVQWCEQVAAEYTGGPAEMK